MVLHALQYAHVALLQFVDLLQQALHAQLLLALALVERALDIDRLID